MRLDTLGKRRDRSWFCAVSSFEDWDNSALATQIGHLSKLLSDPFVVEFSDCRVGAEMNLVLLMSIKTSRYQDKVWVKLNQFGNHIFCEGLAPFWALGVSRVNRIVINSSRTIWFLFVNILLCYNREATCVWIEVLSVKMHRLELDVVPIVFVQPGFVDGCLPWIIIVKNA